MPNRFIDNDLSFIKIKPKKESEGKFLTPDQKRLHWEAYAKKTERQEEVFKKVFENVFEEQKGLVIAELERTGKLPPILNDELIADLHDDKGGEGSGNFGHGGRPGEVGGSGEGGGGGIPGGRNPRHTAFDNLYNEGGEGYNPYPEYNERSPTAPSSGEKRDSINRKLNSIDYNDPANTARRNELRNKYKQSYVDDGWTQSVTQERRQSWNSAVRSSKYTNPAGKITSGSLAKMESDLGFTRGDLSEAVRVHGLK